MVTVFHIHSHSAVLFTREDAGWRLLLPRPDTHIVHRTYYSPETKENHIKIWLKWRVWVCVVPSILVTISQTRDPADIGDPETIAHVTTNHTSPVELATKVHEDLHNSRPSVLIYSWMWKSGNRRFQQGEGPRRGPSPGTVKHETLWRFVYSSISQPGVIQSIRCCSHTQSDLLMRCTGTASIHNNKTPIHQLLH